MKYICSLFFLFPIIAFAAPRVAIDSAAVDFGEVAANAALVREMRVGNIGDEPLVVARVKACCGATAVLDCTLPVILAAGFIDGMVAFCTL